MQWMLLVTTITKCFTRPCADTCNTYKKYNSNFKSVNIFRYFKPFKSILQVGKVNRIYCPIVKT